MTNVNCGHYTVSDQRLRDVLENIAREIGQSVNVTSGDRNNIPRGSSKGSLHLLNEAVDFHIQGISDETAFRMMRMKRKAIFGDAKDVEFRFQIIRHGSHTATQGGHLHLGYVPEGGTQMRGFVSEGLTPATKGKYDYVELP